MGLCIWCGDVEDNLHVLRNCLGAQKVWQKIPDIPMESHIHSFKEWFAAVLGSKLSVSLELVGMCAWQICGMRFVLRK